MFVGTHLHVDTTQVLSVGGSLPLMELPEFDIKPSLGSPLLVFPQDYLQKFLPQGDTSAKQRAFEIKVFPLLGELPKAIEPHLPACQLYRGQLGPTKWSSHTTKSIDPIVATALQVSSKWKASDPRQVNLPAIVWCQRHAQLKHQGMRLINY